MRQLFAVALVVAVVAAPAWAQRGGGARGGGGGFHGGGFASHAGFANRGGVAAGGHGFAGRAYAPRYGAGVRAFRGVPEGRLAGQGVSSVRPGFYSPRPGFYNRGWEHRPYGVPYVYGAPLGYGNYGLGSGWVDTDYPGYWDDGSYDDDSGSYGAGDYGAGDDAPGVAGTYVEQPRPAYYGEPQEQQEQGQAQMQSEAPAPVEQAPAAAVAPSLYDSDAVTLVFKDGRPPETIHNYALTRTTLYVTDGRRREIPVAALDLAATEKANREAGVSFQLPVAQ